MTEPEPPDLVYDCIVVGAGPAGSTSARELARRGARVLLVDKATFPRPKVCGCCVNPRSLAILAGMGLGDLTTKLGAVQLTSMELATKKARATIRHPLGAAVSREAFDAALVEAATDAGATFVSGARADLRPAASPEFRTLRLHQDGRSWEARGRFIVSATGLTDGLFQHEAKTPGASNVKIGAGAIASTAADGYEPHRIYMACGDDGYVGLVVLEDGRLDLAAALKPSAVREAGGIGPLADRILSRSRLPLVPGVSRLGWKGTPLLTRSPSRLAEDRVFRVGDSAGYVEPFTGEGMAWALAGGQALAAILAEALERDDDPALAWTRAYRREVGRRQVVCRLARLTLRTPWMTRSLVRVLSLRPELARPFLSIMHAVP